MDEPKAINEGDSMPEILKPGDPMEEWDQFVETSPQGCIFCKSWWLEAVAPGVFEILVVRKGGQIAAGMPLVRYRLYGLEAIHMPLLTQTLGPLLAPTSGNYEKRLSAETDLLTELIGRIPRVAHFTAFCHHSLTNWLPFYWAGYQQTTRYTYVIEDLSDLDAVFAAFAHSKRKNIKKAEQAVTVHEDMPLEDFYRHHKMTLAKQGDVIFYSLDLFRRIHQATYSRGVGKTWYAVGEDGAVQSAIFVVLDAKSAYYLISTIDPAYRNVGSATLLVRDAIKYVATRTCRFDFEGSMVQGVEHSFRKFGAVQKPYFNITQNKLPLWARAGWAMRNAWVNWRQRRPKAQQQWKGSNCGYFDCGRTESSD
jgi:GNAT superfamily N-acetyltransferase